jgi:hypothetical protein
VIAGAQREYTQADAWRDHADGQMRSARRVKERLARGEDDGITRAALRDCVACARQSRRVAREMRRAGAR